MEKKEEKRQTAEQVVKEIRRRTRRVFSAEEKIKIVLEGMRGEDTIAALRRKPARYRDHEEPWAECHGKCCH